MEANGGFGGLSGQAALATQGLLGHGRGVGSGFGSSQSGSHSRHYGFGHGGSSGGHMPRRGGGGIHAPLDCYSVYVGNIPLQLTEEHMVQLFESFGTVINAAVVQKTEDYKYGFVNFEKAQDAASALVTMNGKQIGGKTLQVKPANTDLQRAQEISRHAEAILLQTNAGSSNMNGTGGASGGMLGSSASSIRGGHSHGRGGHLHGGRGGHGGHLHSHGRGGHPHGHSSHSGNSYGGLSPRQRGGPPHSQRMGQGQSSEGRRNGGYSDRGSSNSNSNSNGAASQTGSSSGANGQGTNGQTQGQRQGGSGQHLSPEEAARVLTHSDGRQKIWKVQYGEDWHEYDTTLAAIVEGLRSGEQIQITLQDSDYIITRLNDSEALQQNLATGTTRKALRELRAA